MDYHTERNTGRAPAREDLLTKRVDWWTLSDVRVFLSWSGQKSQKVAEALYDWLPMAVNAVEPWMSSDDIEKGATSIQSIGAALQECSFGIICLTRENQERPWINYEAGALAKAV